MTRNYGDYGIFLIMGNARFLSSTVGLKQRSLSEENTISIVEQFSELGSLLGVRFTRVPYYIGDPKRDPNLENYPIHAPDMFGDLQPWGRRGEPLATE